MLQTGNRWSSQMLDFSERLGAHTSMLVDADGDYAHEFWEENKALRPTVGPKKQPSFLETSHESIHGKHPRKTRTTCSFWDGFKGQKNMIKFWIQKGQLPLTVQRFCFRLLVVFSQFNQIDIWQAGQLVLVAPCTWRRMGGIGGWGPMLRKVVDILEKRRGNFGWLFFFGGNGWEVRFD